MAVARQVAVQGGRTLTARAASDTAIRGVGTLRAREAREAPEAPLEGLPFPQPVAQITPAWLQVRVQVRCTQEWSPYPFFVIPVGTVLEVREITFHQSIYNEAGTVLLDRPDLALAGAGRMVEIPLHLMAQHFQPIEGEGGVPEPRNPHIQQLAPRLVAVQDPEPPPPPPSLPDWLAAGSTIVSRAPTRLPPFGVLPAGTVARAGEQGMIHHINQDLFAIEVNGDYWTLFYEDILAHWGPLEESPRLIAYEHLLDD